MFLVDADERATLQLAEEVRATIARPDALDGYHVAREYWFGDRRMRSMYPDCGTCGLKMFYEYQISLKLEELEDPRSPLWERYRDLLER